jgi:hypothetical protein
MQQDRRRIGWLPTLTTLVLAGVAGRADTWRLEAEAAGEGSIRSAVAVVDVSNPRRQRKGQSR